MDKEFKFDNVYTMHENEKSVTIGFSTSKDDYALVLRLHRNYRGDRSIVLNITDCFNNGLCSYSSYMKSLTIRKAIARTEETYCVKVSNDELLKASIMLQAYRGLFDKQDIPQDLINKWYELATLVLNDKRFKVSLNNGAWEYI